MANLMFSKEQIVGITELQRNAGSVSLRSKEKDILILKNNHPFVVMLDYERYEELLEKAEQADIYAVLSKRKNTDKWLTTREVLEGLSFVKGNDVVEQSQKRGKPRRSDSSD
ncbi:MAG: type II toxin-antitoxin system prevent-host-death family antitoxin [Bacillota bacterium]